MGPQRFLILLADDDADLRGLFRDVLVMEGFDIAEARDGMQCLEKVQEARPSVIFLDVDMPKINGWDVCRKLKKSRETKDIPIIMISAYARREDKTRALSCGADMYLSKPVDIDLLIPLLRKLTAIRG